MDANSPLKKPPGEGTGPTIHADFRGNLVGRVPSRGERDVFQQAAKGVFEKWFAGSTGDPPVSSGDSPDGTKGIVRANGHGFFATLPAAVPVGGSPTGTGGSPAPPIFKQGSAMLSSVPETCPLPSNDSLPSRAGVIHGADESACGTHSGIRTCHVRAGARISRPGA